MIDESRDQELQELIEISNADAIDEGFFMVSKMDIWETDFQINFIDNPNVEWDYENECNEFQLELKDLSDRFFRNAACDSLALAMKIKDTKYMYLHVTLTAKFVYGRTIEESKNE